METQFSVWPDALTFDPNTAEPEAVGVLEALGAEAVARGRVAVLVMAGGDGSRLGCHGPKGCYNLDGRSLFDILFARIDADFKKAQELSTYSNPAISTPLVYLMCSPTNVGATQDFIQSSPSLAARRHLRLLTQGTLPVLAEDKSTALVSGLVSPSGNGAIYECLYHSGALDEMQSHGVAYVSICTVDNVLSRPLDLSCVGAAFSHNSQVVNKVCRRAAKDRVGIQVVSHAPVLGEDDVLSTEHTTPVDVEGGYSQVCEYFELPPALSESVDAEGNPIFWHANLAMHLLSVPFLRRVADEKLWSLMPIHLAHRAVSYTDPEGHRVEPSIDPFTGQEKPNAYKQERFVFDAFRFAPLKHCLCYVVDRATDFEPLKDTSCLASVREALERCPTD